MSSGMPCNARLHECHYLIVLQVRQTAVSYDASTILACCEDGTIWRWDSTAALAASDEEASAREVMRAVMPVCKGQMTWNNASAMLL